MKRSKVTYGQLDKALHLLGLTCRLVQGVHTPALVYDHKETGASFTIPPFPKTDFVLEYHLVGARTLLDLFGVVEPEDFDAILRKVKDDRKRARSPKRAATGGDRNGTPRRAEVTYGQLDKVLRSLGFSCRVLEDPPPARLYDHKKSGAMIMMPLFPETDLVLENHLVAARTTLDLFGIAEPEDFDALLRKSTGGRKREPRRREIGTEP